MIQVDASVFIILCELLALLLAIVAFLIISRMRSRGKLKKAVKALVEQIKQQSKTRTQETGSFLKELYELDEQQLSNAVSNIDKQEKKFFQRLVDVIGFNEVDKIKSIDADLAALIDVYKSLKPKIPEVKTEDSDDTLAEIEKLKKENASLEDELVITKNTMSDMIGEFGNMFGGGSDHELASHEVVDQVKPKSEESSEESVIEEALTDT